jgi:hypothetical protein
MAMNYSITFVSLRAGTVYTLSIGGGEGATIALHGAAEPFVTDEDDSEDMFTPVRSQSGYFRIVDNGTDANGNQLTADWWKDLVPAVDSDRPVVLTAASTVVWQGFVQSQTFSGELYGNPQEREFPVVCPLGMLAGEDADYTNGIRNFAFVLKEVCDTISSKSDGAVSFDRVMVQGGADARQWLLTRIDWMNFASTDGDGVTHSKYSLFSVLEDMCRFWGWTARTRGTTIYLTCSDDSVEQDFLSLTMTQLATLAAADTDTTTGSIVSPTTVTLVDTFDTPIFASTSQDDYVMQGPHKAVVKSDCNQQSSVAKFAPKDIEDWMGDFWGWVPAEEGNYMVGYFGTTERITGSEGVGDTTMKVWTTPSNEPTGRICKRQIYQSVETESPTMGDMLCVLDSHKPSVPSIQLQTLRPMSFAMGSITLEGTVWRGYEPLRQGDNLDCIRVRLGIGMTRATAKWFKFPMRAPFGQVFTPEWVSEPTIFNVPMQGSTMKGAGTAAESLGYVVTILSMPAIPVNVPLFGYVFLDIMGAHDYSNGLEIESFEIANLSLGFSRGGYDITVVGRPRQIKQDRVSSKEYVSVNTNDSKEEWNANCIFASDDNMEFGYGLLMNADGSFVATVPYGEQQEHPEQHLADRVADYWATSKRCITTELLSNVAQSVVGGGNVIIGNILPSNKITVNGTTFTPAAIGRDWCEDVVRISLMEI